MHFMQICIFLLYVKLCAAQQTMLRLFSCSLYERFCKKGPGRSNCTASQHCRSLCVVPLKTVSQLVINMDIVSLGALEDLG